MDIECPHCGHLGDAAPGLPYPATLTCPACDHRFQEGDGPPTDDRGPVSRRLHAATQGVPAAGLLFLALAVALGFAGIELWGHGGWLRAPSVACFLAMVAFFEAA